MKSDAKFELLEEWQAEKCLLTKFYNASQIEEVEKFSTENKNLEEVLKFLQVRGILINENIISFRDAINSVKKYAENFVDDELTINFVVQMWTAESKLKTKIKKFLPTFSEEILAEIEKNPDRIFDSANKSLAILKSLRREKILPLIEKSCEELFHELKIIFHGSEGEIKNSDGFNYQPESILTGVAAYKFLSMLKSSEKQKVWLEFFYGDYAHGKFLISEKDFELLADNSATDFFKSHLNKNRQQIFKNPLALKKYISPKIMIRTEDIFNQINFESENFQSAMKNFEQEEMKYLENH